MTGRVNFCCAATGEQCQRSARMKPYSSPEHRGQAACRFLSRSYPSQHEAHKQNRKANRQVKTCSAQAGGNEAFQISARSTAELQDLFPAWASHSIPLDLVSVLRHLQEQAKDALLNAQTPSPGSSGSWQPCCHATAPRKLKFQRKSKGL